MSAAVKIPVRMSTDEFLNWNPGDGLRWQLVDGEPRCMAPATRTHRALQAELSRLLGNHLREQHSPCSIIAEPGIVPHLLSDHNVRIPDLAVTCSPYEVEESALADPVLVIEILSPSNQSETWANIWAYTSIPSVREILVIRTDVIGCEMLRRRPDHTWPSVPTSIVGGEIVLESIGFRVSLRDIYATTRLARGQAAGGSSR